MAWIGCHSQNMRPVHEISSFHSGLLTDRLYVSCAYIQVSGKENLQTINESLKKTTLTINQIKQFQLAAGILCLANSLFGGYAAFREVK